MKSILRGAAIAMAVVVFSYPALAATAPNVVVTAGSGAALCEEHNRLAAKDPGETNLFHYAWVIGWLSGFNAALNTEKKKEIDLAAMSVNDQMAFINDYCLKNPKHIIEDAAEALGIELVKHSR